MVTTEEVVHYHDTSRSQDLAQPCKHFAVFILAGTTIGEQVHMGQGYAFIP
jgi:hypothetical protein